MNGYDLLPARLIFLRASIFARVYLPACLPACLSVIIAGLLYCDSIH